VFSSELLKQPECRCSKNSAGRAISNPSLSTQVYTPIGRTLEFPREIFEIPQVSANPGRKPELPARL
jgi:hypothetical protein